MKIIGNFFSVKKKKKIVSPPSIQPTHTQHLTSKNSLGLHLRYYQRHTPVIR